MNRASNGKTAIGAEKKKTPRDRENGFEIVKVSGGLQPSQNSCRLKDRMSSQIFKLSNSFHHPNTYEETNALKQRIMKVKKNNRNFYFHEIKPASTAQRLQEFSTHYKRFERLNISNGRNLAKSQWL